MNEILIGAGIVFGVAGFFGMVLAAANRWLSVEEDPRIDSVEGMLPGTNCGACGQPGCRVFAETLVQAETIPGKCTVSSRDAVERIALFLGVEAGHQEKRVARLHCAGGRSSVRQAAEYHGLDSCRAAFVVNGGGKACPWGCLGLADCERACTFDAIRMSDEALPVVDVEGCTACGDCVEVCPLNLFTLEPLSAKTVVQCSCPLTGETATQICRVACDACGRCAQDAAEGAIVMCDGLPVVREPDRTTADCTFRCPTGAIRWVEGNQFEEGADDSGGATPHA
jgi:Na+-translocating ferredoxin:NAD+ oxidoreductase RNF subunit RnfB